MIIYLLKFSACIAVFWCFYRFFLEKESFHVFKRFFLLSAILVSIIIPLITFTQYVTSPEISESTLTSASQNLTGIIPTGVSLQSYLPEILFIIYLVGVVIFGLRFAYNLNQISIKINNNPKKKYRQFTNVLLHDLVSPHTFFNYIFLNKVKFENHQIPKEVLLHEQTHAKQKHAIDILFLELIQVILWFNPLIYLIKKDIKLNHEFLADQAVIKEGVDTKSYQSLLLAFSSNATTPKLANAINYSLIKKRFTVMKTKTSTLAIRIKSLVLLPLLAILIYSFSDRNIIEIPIDSHDSFFEIDHDTKKATPAHVNEYNTLAKQYNENEEVTRKDKLNDVVRLEILYNEMTDSQKKNAESFPNLSPKLDQDGASRDQMAEYTTLAKKYNAMSKDNYIIKSDEVKRLKYIYGLMSDKQKKNADPFPNFPAPPPPPPPNEKELKDAQIAAKVMYVKARKVNQKAKLAHSKEAKKNYDAQIAVKAKYVVARKDMGKAKLARVAEVNENKDVAKAVKIKYVKEKDALKKAKIAQAAELKETNETLRAEKIKYVKEREAVKADKIKSVKVKKAKLNAEKAALAEIKEVRSVESPVAHIKRMTEKNALFYFEGKKITSKKAQKLVKENPELHIQTRLGHEKIPEVYISSKPITVKEND